MKRLDVDEVWDSEGNLVSRVEVWRSPSPLDAAGVAATLNAVLGVWPLEDAANAVGLTPEDLIAEAEGWEEASSLPL